MQHKHRQNQVVAQSNIPSDANNTTVALTSAETWTGGWERARGDGVTVSCKTDNSGTLFFDFSNDATNVDTFPVAGFKVASGIHEYHTAKVNGRFFRLRFVNDAGDQTYLRIYSYYGAHTQPNAPLNQAYGLDNDSVIVRSSLPWLDIARGLSGGISKVEKFGRNPAVGTSFVPVCIGGVYQTPQVASATTLRIKAGGNTNDTAAGSGAREVTIIGTDASGNEITEAITTDGSSASAATSQSFMRVYRAYVSESGTYASSTAGSHAGDITIENSGGGTDWFTIDSTDFPKGQSEIGAYTVPSGFTAHVFLSTITVDSTKSNDIIFFQRTGILQTAAPYDAMRAQSVITGLKDNLVLSGRQEPLGPFVGPCDIGFMAKVDTGTAGVAVEFEIFLVNE